MVDSLPHRPFVDWLEGELFVVEITGDLGHFFTSLGYYKITASGSKYSYLPSPFRCDRSGSFDLDI
jgi:hypothetical protein